VHRVAAVAGSLTLAKVQHVDEARALILDL